MLVNDAKNEPLCSWGPRLKNKFRLRKNVTSTTPPRDPFGNLFGSCSFLGRRTPLGPKNTGLGKDPSWHRFRHHTLLKIGTFWDQKCFQNWYEHNNFESTSRVSSSRKVQWGNKNFRRTSFRLCGIWDHGKTIWALFWSLKCTLNFHWDRLWAAWVAILDPFGGWYKDPRTGASANPKRVRA